MLDQSIEEVRSCKDLAEKRLDEIISLRGTTAADAQLIAILQDIVKRSDERIKYLESIKCSEFSLFKLGALKLFHSKRCS